MKWQKLVIYVAGYGMVKLRLTTGLFFSALMGSYGHLVLMFWRLLFQNEALGVALSIHT